MLYRPCGKTGVQLPVVSFGGMRLGRLVDNQDKCNELIARCIALGITYFETCRSYGESEVQIGRALDETGLRKQAILSTKTNDSHANDADGVRRAVEEQLKRLRTDHLEFYQLWNIGSEERFQKLMAPGRNYDTLVQLRDEGVIDHIGCTVHAPNEDVIRWIETGAFESITVYYNAVQREVEPVVKRAAELGMGIQVMGPLNGGLLGDAAAHFEWLRHGGAKSNAQGAIRWILGHPEITCVLSGISRVSEAEENAAVADLDLNVSAEEYAEVERHLVQFDELRKGLCTQCGYCKGCPSQIEIWTIMQAMNTYQVYGALATARERFNRYMKKGAGPDACTECGECVEKCPQHLDIPARLKEAQATFGKK